MASKATLHTHYIGKVLPNGHLEIPKTVVESMDLKDGDEVVVALHKVTAAGGDVPAEVQPLMQELVETPSSLQETVEALTHDCNRDDASKATKAVQPSPLEEPGWYNHCPKKKKNLTRWWLKDNKAPSARPRHF